MSEKPSKEKTVANLYAEFSRQNTKGEYDRALKTINKILQLDSDDNCAFECKVVMLIFLSRFEEAMQQIKKNSSLASNLVFEHAYCLYRTNNPKQSLAVLESHPELDQRMRELKAQILYRLEHYDQAMAVYNEMMDAASDNDEYDEERRINIAAIAALVPDGLAKYGKNLVEETYELCYNKALVYANDGCYVEAEKLLRTAEKLLKEAYEEDGATEDETESELAHIRILQAYCSQRQGRMKEAHQLYSAALKSKLDDATLTVVASNNIVALNKDQNVFDSKKKIKVASNEVSMAKLPIGTKKTIALNNAIFHYHSNQHDQSDRLCTSIVKQWPDLEVRTKILRALNARKANPEGDPIPLLVNIKSDIPEDDLHAKLTCVHLLLSKGDKEKACEVLQDLGDWSYQPGIVGALITIYTNIGKEDKAVQIYEKAIGWHKIKEKSSKDMVHFFKQAAEFQIRNGRPEVAAKSLEQVGDKDMKTTAQLVLAYAQFDSNKAAKACAQLNKAVNLKEDVDLDNLESISWLTTKTKTAGGTPKTDVSPGPNDAVAKKRKHRKHKPKLPKDYDASQTPDPERWLPKYERTGFRKKRDRRMKDIIKGSQGTTAGQSDQYDFSKVVAEQEDTSSVEPSPMQRGGNNQNKKGKGNQKKKGGKRR